MSRALDELTAPELSLRLHQQGRVADFGYFALRQGDLQTILDKASEVAAEGLDTRFAKVLEFDPEQNNFLVRSGVGWKPGVVGHARVGGGLESPAAYAFHTGKPVISNDLSTEGRFSTPGLLRDHGISSAVNVLVKANDDGPYGVLEVDSTHRSNFTVHDGDFLKSLANTLAVAVEMQKREQARDVMLREKEALLLSNQALLREKDLLMQEVHHRVRNSLQLVRTILTMQARTTGNTEAREEIEKASGRIMAIAAVHQRLYERGSITDADAGEYLRGLLEDMRGLVPEARGNRSLHVDIEPFVLPADDLTALGLITGELVTNALKHGSGRITVTVQRDADGLVVSVEDEGNGFPDGFDPTSRTGLGMRVVAALAKMAPGEAVRVDRSVPHGKLTVRMSFGGHAHAPGRT